MRRRAARVLAAAILAIALGSCVPAPRVETIPPPASPPRPLRVAIVLGGGGSRGFAHVGVLRALEEEKLPIDLIVGTSAGSLIGALYADRADSFQLEADAWQVNKEDLFDWSLIGSSQGLVTGRALQDFVRSHVRAPTIEQLKIPFAAVATDLATGQPVVLNHGPVAEAVRASSSIPGIFRPAQIGGRTLVDGGVAEPIPVSIARSLGADVVIAVDISAALPPEEEPGNLASITLRCISILMRELARQKIAAADVVITPKVGNTSPFDFTQKRELMAAGLAAGREAVPRIREALDRAGSH